MAVTTSVPAAALSRFEAVPTVRLLHRINFHTPWPRPLWDATSRSFFQPDTVQCEATGASAARLEHAALRGLTGAPRNSHIQAIASDRAIDIVVGNEAYFDEPYRISLCREGGRRTVKVHGLHLKEQFRLHGIGVRMFVLMVKSARRLGVPVLTGQALHGAYGDGPLWSGALAAAKVGWDAELPPDYLRAMPDFLSDAETLRELLLHPGGRDWWDRHPTALQLRFDTSSHSTSMQFLQRYVGQHRIRLHQ